MTRAHRSAAVLLLVLAPLAGAAPAAASPDARRAVELAQANPPPFVGNDVERSKKRAKEAAEKAKAAEEAPPEQPKNKPAKAEEKPAEKPAKEQKVRQERAKEVQREKPDAARARAQNELRELKARQDAAKDARRQKNEEQRFRGQVERDELRARQLEAKEEQRRRATEKKNDRERRAAPVVIAPVNPAVRPSTTYPEPRAAERKLPRDVRARRREDVRESYRRAVAPNRSFDDLKRNRRERTLAAGNLRVIEEPDRRVIVKQDNRTFIRHDESERFRRISPGARTLRRSDGTSTTVITRRGGVRIYDVTDRHGRIVQRYRRYPNGREVILIDNRRHYARKRNRAGDVLLGAGIGLAIGTAVALAAPEVRIPRERYIVDYGRASDDDLYEALSAPPVERLERGYSLDEVRYSRHLRDRMRRIDLDTVTFDFGSWEVGPDQGRALDRLAEGINRVLERTPEEIFMIEGHTDAVGSPEDNLTLSDRRAQAVAEILTIEYGVPPENLVTQGYGEEQLKIPTDGPERLNRRITVRRIGPLLTGAIDDRYSGAPRRDDVGDDRIDGESRGYGDDQGFDDQGYDDRGGDRSYDYDRDRFDDGR